MQSIAVVIAFIKAILKAQWRQYSTILPLSQGINDLINMGFIAKAYLRHCYMPFRIKIIVTAWLGKDGEKIIVRYFLVIKTGGTMNQT